MLYHIIFGLVRSFSTPFYSLLSTGFHKQLKTHLVLHSPHSFPQFQDSSSAYMSGQTDHVVKGLPQSWKAPVQVQRLPTFWLISVDKLLYKRSGVLWICLALRCRAFRSGARFGARPAPIRPLYGRNPETSRIARVRRASVCQRYAVLYFRCCTHNMHGVQR